MRKSNSDTSTQDVFIFIFSRTMDLIQTCFVWSLWPGAVFLCVRELAGKETIVNVIVEYFSKSSNLAPWSLSFVFFIWALSERVVRRKKTASMSGHTREIEEIIDPNRSSSNLTASGQTPQKIIKSRKH